MSRQGIKEYKAPEALTLIAADREQASIVCPSCGASEIERTPRRGARGKPPSGKVTLHCVACDRSAVYIDRRPGGDPLPEAPRSS